METIKTVIKQIILQVMENYWRQLLIVNIIFRDIENEMKRRRIIVVNNVNGINSDLNRQIELRIEINNSNNDAECLNQMVFLFEKIFNIGEEMDEMDAMELYEKTDNLFRLGNIDLNYYKMYELLYAVDKTVLVDDEEQKRIINDYCGILNLKVIHT